MTSDIILINDSRSFAFECCQFRTYILILSFKGFCVSDMLASAVDPIKKRNIDDLDTEDQMRWVKELLEEGRPYFEKFMIEVDLINRLVEKKVLSKYNQKQFNKLSLENADNEEKVNELHKSLRSKGWDNFKIARQTLYDLYPVMRGSRVWDEDIVNELPVLNLKYQRPDAQTDGNSGSSKPKLLHSPDGDTSPDGLLSSQGGPKLTTSEPDKKDLQYSSMPIYNLQKKPLKGYCLIINNENYSKVNGFNDRMGSTVDAEKLYRLFNTELGFHVEHQSNMTVKSLRRLIKIVKKPSQGQLEKYSCFVAVLLSHGGNTALSCVDGESIEIDDIINSFKADVCSALAGTPKWFIVQACRGAEYNNAIKVTAPGAYRDGHSDGGNNKNVYQQMSDKAMSIPACSDFFLSYATAPGYFSFRHVTEGSWFINDLCQVLYEFAHYEDINTMMMRVNRKVAVDRDDKMGGNIRKQMPCHVNMLTSALFLHHIKTTDHV